jgi:hypothetical protein
MAKSYTGQFNYAAGGFLRLSTSFSRTFLKKLNGNSVSGSLFM